MANKNRLLTKFPDALTERFIDSQEFINGYFKNSKVEVISEEAKLLISKDRYILIRSDALAESFYRRISKSFQDLNSVEVYTAAKTILYDLAFNIGYSDALEFFKKTEAEDPWVKMSLGPILFSKLSWGHVEILEESVLSSDYPNMLLFDHHQSFEAESWKKNGGSKFTVCHMNAGYSAGWISASFGMDMKCEELLCAAKGDSACRFIIGPTQSFKESKASIISRHPHLFG